MHFMGVESKIPASYFAKLAGVSDEMVRRYAKLLREVVPESDLFKEEFESINE